MGMGNKAFQRELKSIHTLPQGVSACGWFPLMARDGTALNYNRDQETLNGWARTGQTGN